jgi:hypothetical protein
MKADCDSESRNEIEQNEESDRGACGRHDEGRQGHEMNGNQHRNDWIVESAIGIRSISSDLIWDGPAGYNAS